MNHSSLTISSGCSIDHNFVEGGWVGNVPGCAESNNNNGLAGLVNALLPPFDFHLTPYSSAIDAGIPVNGVATDFDGMVRPQGAAFDVGAFEYPARQSSTSEAGTKPVEPPRKSASRKGSVK